MDYTARMVVLLGEMRRERNGAVADAMRFYGAPYGLNYGVSLPTLRRLARAEQTNNGLARYLYLQDVRELRLAALHIADPAEFTEADADFWAVGIVNSEVAEEAAFAFLSRIPLFQTLFHRWISAENPLLQHAALMAAARFATPDAAWIVSTCEAVQGAALRKEPEFSGHLVAQGAVAFLSYLCAYCSDLCSQVQSAAAALPDSAAATYLREELSWRLEGLQ